MEYSDNYLKTSKSLWRYYRDEPFVNDDWVFIDLPNNPDSTSFKYKQKITSQTEHDGTKAVQIMVPLKYWSNFWGTFIN